MHPDMAPMAVILAALYVAGNMCAWFQLNRSWALAYSIVTTALFCFWLLESFGVTDLV